MDKYNSEKAERYFTEAAICFRRKGFTPLPRDGDVMPVEFEDQPLCSVTSGGGIRYKPEDICGDRREKACLQAEDIAAVTAEYMGLLEDAPPLKASGISADYRLLADFNDTVLAGHPTTHGVEFVTWKWSWDKTGLYHGHYLCEYEKAKQDFAKRSGLVPGSMLFSESQLAEIFHCVNETLENDSDLGLEREKVLNGIKDQISRTIPDIDTPANQSSEQKFEQSF